MITALPKDRESVSVTQGLALYSKDCGPVLATNFATYIDWMDHVIFKKPLKPERTSVEPTTQEHTTQENTTPEVTTNLNNFPTTSTDKVTTTSPNQIHELIDPSIAFVDPNLWLHDNCSIPGSNLRASCQLQADCSKLNNLSIIGCGTDFSIICCPI